MSSSVQLNFTNQMRPGSFGADLGNRADVLGNVVSVKLSDPLDEEVNSVSSASTSEGMTAFQRLNVEAVRLFTV